jgi:hypothetical protein
MFTTNSRVFSISGYEYRPVLTPIPIVGGFNEKLDTQANVIMFVPPFSSSKQVTRTTGVGNRKFGHPGCF